MPQHWVYEGSSFAICKRALEEVRCMFSRSPWAELASDGVATPVQVDDTPVLPIGGTVKFKRVLALKQQAGELLKGRPYVDGAVVEGRLEDEFK